MTVIRPSVSQSWDHLDRLESESIHILREVVAQSAKPVLLFSGGKDSMVVLHLARKAFHPHHLPFPLMHVDTGHNFPEVIDFRDRIVAQYGVDLVVRSVEDSIRQGRARVRSAQDSRNALQAITLVDAIHELGFDACMGGARRDEEKARAKERIFSFRDEFGGWDPKNQRPELWDLYNARVHPGENMRVFPISNWTELDVWEYICQEKLELPSLYFAHSRAVVARGLQWVPITELTPAREGETVEQRSVRFRTVGDMTCTCPVLSEAQSVQEILRETETSELTERGATRQDDQTSEASMELRKRQGYF
ncbi:MAG: sulfate adenylyltransferase subunit CysD [Betaproteobacteria bacterium]|jgi:sulfate adenylyltransferase subunit 2 (EC 2.7.7.4)|nr:sulfate adenylyltransferase subunit CysD [Betaproteobacteria bacterium]